jgi:hypothetical protein
MKKTQAHINLSNISRIILMGLKSLRVFLTETVKSPFAKRYMIMSVILFIFFMIITFPFDIIVTDHLKKLEGKSYRSINFDQFTIAPFRKITAALITITTLQKGEIVLTGSDFDLDTLSLIGGNIDGDFLIKDLRYQSDTIVFSGALDGEIDLDLDQSRNCPENGSFSINISNLSIKGITIAGFSIKPVQISSASVNTSVKSRVMTIDSCTFKGKDMNGLLRGTVTFDPDIGRSTLSLTLEITSDSAMLADFKPLLGSYINQSTGRLSLSIQGPFANPTIQLINQNQSQQTGNGSVNSGRRQ